MIMYFLYSAYSEYRRKSGAEKLVTHISITTLGIFLLLKSEFFLKMD